MTNEEKAKEIANKNYRHYEVEEIVYGEYYYVETDSKQECKQSALEMAKWKEKEMIEKACEWLEKNARNARDYVWHDEAMCGAGVTDKFINDFKKAMEE